MADYIVTIRTKDGSLSERDYTANDRAELFQKLAADGVTAVRVSEGAAVKKPRKAVKKVGAPSKWRGLLAAAIVVLGAGLAVWWMMKGENSVAPKKEAKEPRKKIVAVVTNVTHRKVEDVKKSNSSARKSPPRITPEQRMSALEKRAREEPLDLRPTTNRVFKTGVEQQIALIFTTPLGNPPPFLAKMTLREESHLAEILMNRVDPNEKDPEKIKEAKEVVELAKAELREYIKEGGDIESFLEYYHGKLQQAFQERASYQSSVMRVIREEPEIAADFIREVNKKLDEKGIRRVTVAPIVAKRIGYEEEN